MALGRPALLDRPRTAGPAALSGVTPSGDRTVLVTGASSGIGLATALELGRAGFGVVGLVRTEAGKGPLLEAARCHGLEIKVVVADLAEPGQRASAVEGLRLWGLVNNAGYMNAGQVRDIEVDEARRQMEVMVLAPVDLARRALPAMLERGEGRIVNLSTGAVHTATPLTGWYQAAKAALRELNNSLRQELRGTGVKVLDIEPGGFSTSIWERGRAELERRADGASRPELYNRVLDNLNKYKAKMSGPEEVAHVIVELMTRAHPPAHRRLGPGSALARVSAELLPDRVWDWMVAHITGLGT